MAATDARARLLVIDDEPVVGDLLKHVLGSEMDVQVERHAPRGLERLLGDERFDLVLCDLSMPMLNGPDIHEQVLARRPELARRMMFITGGAFVDELEDFLEDVDNPVLHKPFTRDELRRSVATALARL